MIRPVGTRPASYKSHGSPGIGASSKPSRHRSASSGAAQLTATAYIPARRAERMAAALSSNTAQRPGATPSRPAARRKTSGSDLPRPTSSAEQSASNQSSMPSRSRQGR